MMISIMDIPCGHHQLFRAKLLLELPVHRALRARWDDLAALPRGFFLIDPNEKGQWPSGHCPIGSPRSVIF
jgi:hypothetical protein